MAVVSCTWIFFVVAGTTRAGQLAADTLGSGKLVYHHHIHKNGKFIYPCLVLLKAMTDKVINVRQVGWRLFLAFVTLYVWLEIPAMKTDSLQAYTPVRLVWLKLKVVAMSFADLAIITGSDLFDTQHVQEDMLQIKRGKIDFVSAEVRNNPRKKQRMDFQYHMLCPAKYIVVIKIDRFALVINFTLHIP